MSAKLKQAKTSLRKAKQYVWYHQERKRHHRSVMGVKPGTAVRANLGSCKRSQILRISRYSTRQERRSRDLQSVKREDQNGIPPSPHFFRIIYLEKAFFTFTRIQE
jgi:hypothetical protein